MRCWWLLAGILMVEFGACPSVSGQEGPPGGSFVAPEILQPAEPPPLPPPSRPAGPPLMLGGPLGALVRPELGRMPTLAQMSGTYVPAQDVVGQPGELALWQGRFGLVMPLAQDAGREWSALVNVAGDFFDGQAVLPDSGRPLPGELWNVRLGLAHRRLLANGWLAGGMVSLGSASDRPFHAADALAANVSAFTRIPHGDDDGWLLSLFYSTTSELWFPVPGAAYHLVVGEDFQALLGLPFALAWRPAPGWTVDFHYLPVRNVHGRVEYRVARPVSLYAAYDWSNEAWFLEDRANERDRLFLYEMRLTAGVKVFAGRNVSVDLHGGYAFERFLFQGRDFDDSARDRIDLGSGPFVGVRVGCRW